MRRPEAALWDYLRRCLAPPAGVHLQRHEDRAGLGIPDVSYACLTREGWLELKALAEGWPARPDTGVDVGLTAVQVNWLEERGRAGRGRLFILVRVGLGRDREHLLFHWSRARTLREERPVRADLYQMARRRWGYSIDPTELRRELIK